MFLFVKCLTRLLFTEINPDYHDLLTQELPLKVQQVLGLYSPPSRDEDRPEVETQPLLDQSGGDAATAAAAASDPTP